MSRPNIIVVDDQSQFLRSLQRALKADLDLILADNLTEAQDAFSLSTSLILTNIRLDEECDDGRQGIDFIRVVRKRNADIPVIAMSALDAPDVEYSAMADGATHFLRKPIVVSNLISLLSELIAKGVND